MKKREFKFKGDKPFIDRDGYKYIPYTPDINPKFSKMFIKRFTPEHRYVMAKAKDRLLEKYEHVHHIDHDRLNNLIDNLELINALDHINSHKDKGNLKLFSQSYQPIKKKKAALQKVAFKNWIPPDLRKEKKYTKDIKNKEGKVVNMNETMWRDITKDPSYKIKTHQSAQKLHATGGKNIIDTIKGLTTGKPTHTPIILKQKNGLHKLIAGNTRLLSARHLKLKPTKVFLIKE